MHSPIAVQQPPRQLLASHGFVLQPARRSAARLTMSSGYRTMTAVLFALILAVNPQWVTPRAIVSFEPGADVYAIAFETHSVPLREIFPTRRMWLMADALGI